MFGLLAFSWVWQLIWCFRMFPCVSVWSMETSSCCWLLRDVTGEALLWLVGFFLMWWRSYEVCLEFLQIQVLKFFSEKFDEGFEFFKWSAWWLALCSALSDDAKVLEQAAMNKAFVSILNGPIKVHPRATVPIRLFFWGGAPPRTTSFCAYIIC